MEEQRLALQRELDAGKEQAERNRMGQFATPTGLAVDILREPLIKCTIGRRAALCPRSTLTYLDDKLRVSLRDALPCIPLSHLIRGSLVSKSDVSRGSNISKEKGSSRV